MDFDQNKGYLNEQHDEGINIMDEEQENNKNEENENNIQSPLSSELWNEGCENTENSNQESEENLNESQSTLTYRWSQFIQGSIGYNYKRKIFTLEHNINKRLKRQQQIISRMKKLLNELSVRCGVQAASVIISPEEKFSVIGTNPLKDVLIQHQLFIKSDLNTVINSVAPPEEKPNVFDLPKLEINGQAVSINSLTQAQLRSFIPLILKYSTGRGKPRWGKEEFKPSWWPTVVPWANIRMDPRTLEEKQHYSWTYCLKQIVKNCYKFHGREELLNEHLDKTIIEEPAPSTDTSIADSAANYQNSLTIVKVDTTKPLIALADGTIAVVQENLPSDIPLDKFKKTSGCVVLNTPQVYSELLNKGCHSEILNVNEDFQCILVSLDCTHVIEYNTSETGSSSNLVML